MDISRNVSKAAETIFGTAAGNAMFTGTQNNQHEELAHTITHIASETAEVNEKIESCQSELTDIRDLSAQKSHAKCKKIWITCPVLSAVSTK